VETVLRDHPINYVLSNHDRVRAFDKFGDGKHNDSIAKLLIMMLLTLRGAPFFYYGEEIGMKTTPPARIEDVQDPIGKVFWPADKGRDGERTPMQWTPGRNAGFSTAPKTWLPVPSTAGVRNVENMEKDSNSILNFFRAAVRMRRSSRAILFGRYESIGRDPNVFIYRRVDGSQEMIVALNMSGEPRTIDLGRTDRLKIVLSSLRRPATGGTRLQLAPFEAVAFRVSDQ
jgi:alpha-glucosidase